MPPPPALLGEKVVAHAVIDKALPYAGRGRLFSGGKILGRVARLALTQSQHGICVVYCGRTWNVRAGFTFPTMREAKRDAERIYPGVSRRWRRVRITKRQLERYIRRIWKGLECRFCDRRPDQFEKMVARGRRVRICDICVREISKTMSSD